MASAVPGFEIRAPTGVNPHLRRFFPGGWKRTRTFLKKKKKNTHPRRAQTPGRRREASRRRTLFRRRGAPLNLRATTLWPWGLEPGGCNHRPCDSHGIDGYGRPRTGPFRTSSLKPLRGSWTAQKSPFRRKVFASPPPPHASFVGDVHGMAVACSFTVAPPRATPSIGEA